MVISGNVLVGNGGHGISLSSDTNALIEGNVAMDNKGDGVHIYEPGAELANSALAQLGLPPDFSLPALRDALVQVPQAASDRQAGILQTIDAFAKTGANLVNLAAAVARLASSPFGQDVLHWLNQHLGS